MTISINELKEILDYDPNTGIFTWKVNIAKNKFAGSIAGNVNNNGYYVITLYRKTYSAHRLAWFYVYGNWPIKDIDHINGNRIDNRIINLRECNQSENQQNRKINKNNSSGYIGVSYHKKEKKWRSRIKVNNKLINLGSFDTPELAHEKYLEAKKEYHTFNPMVR